MIEVKEIDRTNHQGEDEDEIVLVIEQTKDRIGQLLEKERAEKIAKAVQEADSIIAQARHEAYQLKESATEEVENIIDRAHEEARQIIEDAKGKVDISVKEETNPLSNHSTQRNKVSLLKIEKYFDTIKYARKIGKENEKPNPEVYRITLEALRSKPEETICIGDNPYTDFWGAKKLGIRTVRLLSGEFRDIRLSEEYEADLAVRNLEEFSTIIEQSN